MADRRINAGELVLFERQDKLDSITVVADSDSTQPTKLQARSAVPYACVYWLGFQADSTWNVPATLTFVGCVRFANPGFDRKAIERTGCWSWFKQIVKYKE